MKIITTLLIVCCLSLYTLAQGASSQEITTQTLQNIKNKVEKSIPAFKQKLIKKGFNSDQIEFSIDTFRIIQIANKRMEIDFSYSGMNITVSELTESYDKLLNKYYKKLLNSLKVEDKQTLITAQRVWLAFLVAEEKFIQTMTNENYSGGGAIQSNIATGSYSDIVVKRTNELFNYYDNIVKM